MIHIKRVYAEPGPDDGERVLVDRLWPRGLSKERAHIDLWLKDIAPSPALRKWFGHEPARWEEFRERYRAELLQKADLVEMLRRKGRNGALTLVYAARDEDYNDAVVLQELLTSDRP